MQAGKGKLGNTGNGEASQTRRISCQPDWGGTIGGQVTLVPFYKIGLERYSIYFPITN